MSAVKDSITAHLKDRQWHPGEFVGSQLTLQAIQLRHAKLHQQTRCNHNHGEKEVKLPLSPRLQDRPIGILNGGNLVPTP